MTRRSQAAAQAAANTPAPAPSTGISKPVTRRSRAAAASTRKEQSDSWQLLDRESSHAEADHEDLDEQDEAPDMDFSTTRTGGAVQTATDSLRDIADRVGKEVEIFAETLDRFFDNQIGRAHV